MSARYTPSVEFELPAKGWLGGAARGTVVGTKSFIVLVPPAGLVAGVSFVAVCCTFGILAGPGILGALLATAALVKGIGYMIGGPFYGAITAQNPEAVEEAETHLKASLASMRIQETMRDHVVQAANVANVNLKVLDGRGPESLSDLLTYFPLQEASLDTVLELRVNRVLLSSTNKISFKAQAKINPSQELQINPTLSLGLEVRGRLIRTADKVVLFDNTWTSKGKPHLFAELAANDAQLFREEFERVYAGIAGQLSGSIF